MPALLASFKRQQLLLDFAAIKSRCPEGIYLAPEATNPSIWSGVLFVRQGPYASAVLRFELTFPASYPEVGPSVTFATEIFHPLLVPLTTYTFAAGALDPNTTVSASETERLSPGSFNLREGFPLWYPRPANHDSRSARSSSIESGAAYVPGACTNEENNSLEERPSLAAVLQYILSAFESDDFLDSLPLRAALNANAWHAWRAHRGLPKLGSRSISPASVESSRTPLSPGRDPADWNWDGVWESRVRNGIEESISDTSLFGTRPSRAVNNTSIAIRFSKYDDQRTEEIQEAMLRAMDVGAT